MIWNRTRGMGKVVLALTAIISCAPVATAPPDAEPPKAIMDDVFNSLSYLLRLSVDGDSFVSPTDQKTTQIKIDLLSNSAKRLERHAQKRSISFQLLSKTFTETIKEFKSYYDAKQPEAARFFLVDLIQNCVACHSLLPSAGDFPLGQRLIDSVGTDLLSGPDQAPLYVAARRFDDALTIWETFFNDSTVDATVVDGEGYLYDYLVVAIRVLQDLDRPKKTLERFLRRSDLPFYLRYHVEIWLKHMNELNAELLADPNLKRARRIFDQASDLNAFPDSREQTIHDLVASAILYRYLDQQGMKGGKDIAQAYYMLGVIERRTLDRAWAVPPAEHHFEAAIRSAPHGETARKSFAIVEEQALRGYGPSEMMERIDQLREIIGVPTDEKDLTVPQLKYR